MKSYIVVNIGCIECGVSSNIVGVFSDRATADAIAVDCKKKYEWRRGGQNEFQVFELPAHEIVNPEYDAVAIKYNGHGH